MLITGIIAEYNPLHAGHIYHIERTRQETRADYIVAVVDGAFTQRGEPALMDKYARVEMALEAGIDAVFELPQVYAVRPAEIFARGGVDILAGLGVDILSFGCETDDTELITDTARTLTSETNEFRVRLREKLDMGLAYPRALSEALENPYMENPNFTLAVEYVKRILLKGYDMKPHAVRRTEDYHGEGLMSASGVRGIIAEGGDALKMLPGGISRIYEREMDGRLSDPAALDMLTLHTLRNARCENTYPDDAEGLFKRIVNLSASSTGRKQLVEAVKCKRYTYARINRLITNALLDLPEVPKQPYLRLLGVKKSALPLLSELDRRSGGRVNNDFKDTAAFKAECRATDLWGLTTGYPEYRKAGREYTRKLQPV